VPDDGCIDVWQGGASDAGPVFRLRRETKVAARSWHAEPEGGPVPAAVDSLLRRLNGRGHSLDRRLEARMARVLGYDLRAVRVHTDFAADDLTHQLEARAFTWGTDVFFRKGTYDPEGRAGRELIAHELIHVIQQFNNHAPGAGNALTVMHSGDSLERQAEKFAPILAFAAECSACAIPTRRLDQAMPRASDVIQRSPSKMMTAAQTQPPLKNNGGPHTCHDAALGWVLTAEGYSHPWQLITEVKTALFTRHKDIPRWIPIIYNSGRKIDLGDVTSATPVPRPGDVLFTKDVYGVWHSMAVVNSTAGHVYIRGFNNAATFNYVTLNPAAPSGKYDPNDRDVADANLWHGLPHARVFGKAIGAEHPTTHLWLITYANVAHALKTALSHWTYSLLRTPGWQHTGAGQCRMINCPNA
jgi:hypothetical protein